MEPWMQEDYRAALAGIVMASARNDAQLRNAIYELARGKLRQQLHRQAQVLSNSERARRLLALETAIEQIEADLAHDATGGAHAGLFANSGQQRIEIIPPARRLPPSDAAQTAFAAAGRTGRARRARSVRPLVFTLMAVAILAGVTYVGAKLGFSWQPQARSESTQEVKKAVKKAVVHSSNRAPAPGIPIPNAYGVYAVAGGRLVELAALPVRVPGPRVKVSSTISFPSKVDLPTGHLQFVVFRRDLVNKVPDKVAVHVVARVMRSPRPTGTAATMGKEDDLWAIRQTSYEMRVAPIGDNPAMILLRPGAAGFSFPAGRYALALNATAYDFRVEGPITDRAQCIHSDDEDTFAEFTECPSP